MHIPRLSTAASALPIAALLLMGPVSPAQALECAPGYLPAVVDGVETCVVSTYSPAVPVPSYNPGESHYDPSTGNYSEAVPAVPVPAGPSAPAEPTPEATPSTVPPSPASTGSTGGTTGGGAGGNSSVGTPSPSSSRTASPSPSATDAVEEERTVSDLVLPAIAAVVILGLLAGGLLLRHRNRSRD